MSSTEMMQRVVAVLTQAREMLDRPESSQESEDFDPQDELMGEFIAEVLRVDTVVVGPATPEAVSRAVMEALQPRVGRLVGCLAAAYSELALEHDAGNVKSSAEILQALMLRWELMQDDS
jgi:hypothetical protein